MSYQLLLIKEKNSQMFSVIADRLKNYDNIKDNLSELENDINSLREEIELKKNGLDNLNKKYNDLVNEYKNETVKKNLLLNDLGKLNKDEMYLKSQIEILQNSTLNDSKMPYAVKSVLNNYRLNGIHDILATLVPFVKLSTIITLPNAFNITFLYLESYWHKSYV